MKKLLFMLLLPFLLSSCTMIGFSAYYGAENSSDNVFKTNFNPYPDISVPFFPDEPDDKKNIRVFLPGAVGKEFTLLVAIIVPIPAFLGTPLDENEENFYVRVRKNEDQKDFDILLLNIFLKTQDGTIHQGKNDPKERSRFYFPVKIKDVGTKGTIILEYKDIKKEIAFKHDWSLFFAFMFTVLGPGFGFLLTPPFDAFLFL